MKKPTISQDDKREESMSANMKKTAYKFAFIPLLLGVFIAEWVGTNALIPILVVGFFLIIAVIWVKKFEKKQDIQ